jgi:DMSO/TMAO reductase YedYZ molybdopterin-dependent catalytic subunit
MPQPARREALPDHPVPAGLAAPEAWRLRVDGLGGQPLDLSISEVETLGAQAHVEDFRCDEGWIVPEQPWDGVAVAVILGRAGVQPPARFLKVYAGRLYGACATGGGAHRRSLTGTLSQRDAAHAGARGAMTVHGARSGVLL